MTRLQSVYIEKTLDFFSWKPHRKAFEGLPFATQDGRELAALVVIQRQGTNQILFTSILARFDGDQTSNKQMTKPPKTAQTRCVVVHGQHARSRAVPGLLLGHTVDTLYRAQQNGRNKSVLHIWTLKTFEPWTFVTCLTNLLDELLQRSWFNLFEPNDILTTKPIGVLPAPLLYCRSF